MSRFEPLRALRYDPAVAGPLERLVAPPYDVIDESERARLAGQSPYNVVELDLPVPSQGGDPYEHARELLQRWRSDGAVVRDEEPAFWVLEQEFTGPDGRRRTRRGVFARVRVEDYGPGRIRPHERTHPGPKEDRLRLTRATQANLSPIFSLFPDSDGSVRGLLETASAGPPDETLAGPEQADDSLWRVSDPDTIEALQAALAERELLIADGHHRYETARVYAEERGGDGGHSHVLMLLCPLSDPGLAIFPTHRLLTGLDDAKRVALRTALERDFDVTPIEASELEPASAGEGVAFGYLDRYHRRPLRLTLSDPAVAAGALADRPEPFQRLDTAVLEAVVLRDALGMSEDDVAHFRGLNYSKDAEEARALIEAGEYDAAFFLRATPVEQVQEIAETGVSMPPKSTYFFPKVPTGLLFSPLS